LCEVLLIFCLEKEKKARADNIVLAFFYGGIRKAYRVSFKKKAVGLYMKKGMDYRSVTADEIFTVQIGLFYATIPIIIKR
jgi:hypothetical protein